MGKCVWKSQPNAYSDFLQVTKYNKNTYKGAFCQWVPQSLIFSRTHEILRTTSPMAFCTLRSVHIIFSSIGFLIRRVSRGNSPSCFESLFFFSSPRQRLNASLLNKNMEVATSPEKTRGTTKLEYFLEGAWDATSDTKAQSFFHFPPHRGMLQPPFF